MEKKQNILVEYHDQSFQWLKNVREKELVSNKNIKRICAYSYINFEVSTKRWRLGKSQFEKIVIED